MYSMKQDIILEVKNLTVCLNNERKKVKLLDNINLTVLQDQVVGIVGETGSGKTLTMLAIMNMLSANMEIISGSINLFGKDITAKANNRIKNKDVAMIFQNSRLSLSPVYKISAQMKDILKNHISLSRKELKNYCLDWLYKVGFDDPYSVYNKYSFELSGGMLQKIMLAIAMAISPKLLIADEPTTALDADIQQHVLSIIKQFHKKLHNSIVIITHDFSVIKKVCTDVIVIKKGRIIEQNTVKNILQNPQNEYTKQLVDVDF